MAPTWGAFQPVSVSQRLNKGAHKKWSSYSLVCSFPPQLHADYRNKNILWRRKLFLDANQDSLDLGWLLTAVSLRSRWNIFWGKKNHLEAPFTSVIFSKELPKEREMGRREAGGQEKKPSDISCYVQGLSEGKLIWFCFILFLVSGFGQ